jgi:hypothetical protein
VVLAQRFGGLADLALAGQEDEDVAAGLLARELVDGIEDRVLHVLVFLVLVGRFQRVVAKLDRIHPPRHFDHRGTAKVSRKALGLDGG